MSKQHVGNYNELDCLRGIAHNLGGNAANKNEMGALRTIVTRLNAVPANRTVGDMGEMACLRAIVNHYTYGADTGEPALLSSAVIGASGTTMSLIFSEDVKFGAGGNGGWVPTLSGGAATLTYVSGSGTTMLVYALNRTVTEDETGTVAYTQPGNGVEDGSGNDLATIASHAVINNSDYGAFMRDSFAAADDTNLAAYSGEVAGAWSATETFHGLLCVIGANRLRGETGTYTLWRSAGAPDSADYSVYATIRYLTAAGASVGVAGRLDHLGEFGYVALYSLAGGANAWQLYKTNSGIFTQLGSDSAQALSAGTDYVLKLEMIGNSIRVLVDGVEKIAVTDSDMANAGAPGLFLNGAVTNSTGLHIADAKADSGSIAPQFTSTFACVVDGDSLSTDYGLLGTATLSQLLNSRLNTGAIWNYAVPSQTIVQATSDAVAQIDPIFAAMSGYTRKLCSFFCGVNDIYLGDSAATVRTNTETYHAARQSAGFETIAFTIPKAASVVGAAETARAAFNAALRSDHAFADYFVDLDADARFSNTGDTTYFQADGVHFTVAGRTVIADLIMAEVT